MARGAPAGTRRRGGEQWPRDGWERTRKGESHLEAGLGQLTRRLAEAVRIPAAVPRLAGPRDLHYLARAPHRPRRTRRQLRAAVAAPGLARVLVVAARTGAWLAGEHAAGDAARVDDGRGAGRAPRRELIVVGRRVARGVDVERAELRVTDGRGALGMLADGQPVRAVVGSRWVDGLVGRVRLEVRAGPARKVLACVDVPWMDHLAGLPIALVTRDVTAIVEPEARLAVAPRDVAWILAASQGLGAPEHEGHLRGHGAIPGSHVGV